MKRILTAAVATAAVVTAVFAATALAQAPPPSWPPGKIQVFVGGHTLDPTNGQQSSVFTRGSTIVFQSYAVDMKTKKTLVAKDITYYYVAIPGQPNVKLTYGKSGVWSGTWKVPATHPLGVVEFRILVKTTTKRYGSFYQAPVSAAQLTIVQ
jgi:hypothetical protein